MRGNHHPRPTGRGAGNPTGLVGSRPAGARQMENF